MRHRLGCIALLGLACLAAPVAAESTAAKAFEQIKQLVGDWQMVDEQGQPNGEFESTFRLTSGGSAVIETMMPGQPHEMITMYHLDGEHLVLTHYCAFGNQPHLRAEPLGEDGQLHFKCVKLFNGNEKDPHMHEARYRFVDADTFEAQWDQCQDGKCVEMKKFRMQRKK